MMRQKRFSLPWYGWILLAFFGYLAVLLCLWPIIGFDCDLWYHMTGGAYIAAHGHLPDGPFFSYLHSGQYWIIYYWLFQLVVHGLYQGGGYPALIVLRAALMLGTVWCIFCYLWASIKDEERPGGILLVMALTCAYAMALLPRELNLRPHCVTYLCIVLVHYLVNEKPRLIWLLPLVTLLWVNVHGMLYPIMLLVCGAYLAEHFLLGLLRRPECANIRAARWPLIVALYTAIMTPAGLHLLPMPFNPPPYLAKFVQEMFPDSLGHFFSFGFFSTDQWMGSAVSALVVGSLAAALALALTWRLRISRIILLAGGLYLLPQSKRYYYEYLLLVLPLLGDAAALLAARWRRQWSAWAPACIGGLLMAGGLWFMTNSLGFRPQYPLDRARLPIGVSAFLLQEGAGGRVFNVPTPGGYLEWKLSPRYQIFLDMQTMLFSPTDYFTALTAFSDKTVLERTLQRYYPGFLVAYEDDAAFRKTVAHFPHFVPVFFDDLVVLYADDRQYPDLVARFRLAHLDAAGWQMVDFETMTPEARDKALVECRRLLAVYPQGLAANTIAAKILLSQGKPREADAFAGTVLANFPDRYMGYALKGLVAFKEARYAQALAWNRQALQRAMPAEAPMVRRNIYACYVRLKNFPKAYAMLLDVANPMAAATPAKDLYDLALSAVASGHGREGQALLRMARLKTPASDTKLLHDIEDFQQTMATAP